MSSELSSFCSMQKLGAEIPLTDPCTVTTKNSIWRDMTGGTRQQHVCSFRKDMKTQTVHLSSQNNKVLLYLPKGGQGKEPIISMRITPL